MTIRINGIGTQWHDADLTAACGRPDGIVVPKVNSADEVRRLVAAMEKAGAREHTMLWAMVETPQAMLHCEEIAAASTGLPCSSWHQRPAKELHAERRPWTPATRHGAGDVPARGPGHGTVILDGVYNNVKDAEGFEAECLQGRQMGFDGKTLITQGQVDTCNVAFAPTTSRCRRPRASSPPGGPVPAPAW